MKKPREDDIRIATEAAQWQRALENGGPNVRAEFADWLKASPRHLREFMFMEALDAAARDIDPQGAIEVELDIGSVDENVVPMPAARASVPITSRPRTGRYLAAAAVLFAALGWAWWFAPGVLGGWDRYDTSVGEQRTVELTDGSVLQLNTESSVRVRFNSGSREIRLLDGEALFKVAHDTSRPFRVHTNDAVIRAVGTQFNVDSHSGRTRVVVLEGKVEVRPVSRPQVTAPESDSETAPKSIGTRPSLLKAGEIARIDGGTIARDVVTDLSEATAWRQRRLVFREESLAAIAEEFNRYNRSPKIVVEGETARLRRYGGTFDADDPESLVQFVLRQGDLDVERSAARIVIRGE